MKSATAIQKFLNAPGLNPEMSYPRVTVAEIKQFKDSCSPAEWAEFGRQACELLGEKHEV